MPSRHLMYYATICNSVMLVVCCLALLGILYRNWQGTSLYTYEDASSSCPAGALLFFVSDFWAKARLQPPNTPSSLRVCLSDFKSWDLTRPTADCPLGGIRVSLGPAGAVSRTVCAVNASSPLSDAPTAPPPFVAAPLTASEALAAGQLVRMTPSGSAASYRPLPHVVARGLSRRSGCAAAAAPLDRGAFAVVTECPSNRPARRLGFIICRARDAAGEDDWAELPCGRKIPVPPLVDTLPDLTAGQPPPPPCGPAVLAAGSDRLLLAAACGGHVAASLWAADRGRLAAARLGRVDLPAAPGFAVDAGPGGVRGAVLSRSRFIVAVRERPAAAAAGGGGGGELVAARWRLFACGVANRTAVRCADGALLSPPPDDDAGGGSGGGEDELRLLPLQDDQALLPHRARAGGGCGGWALI
jgi:hypothetical protein